MATWELEHVATADRRTIAAWGFERAQRTGVNWGSGELVLTLRAGTAFTDAPLFAYRDKIILWVDNVRVFHGWMTQPERSAEAATERRAYTFAGPWWWLENMPVRDSRGITAITFGEITITLPGGGTMTYEAATGCTWQTGTAEAPGPDIPWSSWEAQSRTTIQGQIRRALYSAIWGGAPIAIGTIGVSGGAPEQEVRNATCASWIQSAARYSPLSVQWWDMSGTTPVFHCAERASATAITHALWTDDEAIALAPLYQLLTHAVRIRYFYMTPETTGGPEVEMYFDDDAGDDEWPDGPGTLSIDVYSGTEDEAGKAWHVGAAAKLFAGLGTLAWAGTLRLHELTTALPDIRPGHALNLTGGRSEWATMAALVQQVTHTHQPESNDLCEITLGAPEHLGLQDWLELANLGHGGASTGSGSDRPVDTSTVPSNYNDLLNDAFPSGPPSGALEFQQRGGTCTLIGFNEFTDPSSPPKKYRQASFGGSTSYVRESTDDSGTLAASGADYFPSAGGAKVYGASATLKSSTANSSAENPFSIGYISFLFGGFYGAMAGTTTQTLETSGYFSQTAYGQTGSGFITEALGDEDTEEDAYARMLAANPWPESWSSSAGVASYQNRTSGFSFSRSMFRYRGEWSNVGHWWSMKITIHLLQRAYGSSETWSDAGTREHVVDADIDGNATLGQQEVEAPKGYEVTVGNIEYTRL